MLRDEAPPYEPWAIFAPMPDKIRKYVLLTGADLGNRQDTLKQASELISELIGKVLDQSDILESEPWGFESDTKFLNQALLIESDKKPDEILSLILGIEQKLGRVRNSGQWTSRTIDIDILCAENLKQHSESLTIPHKLLHERAFALRPLCQLAPSWIHPLLHKTYHQLLNELSSSEVEEVKPDQ